MYKPKKYNTTIIIEGRKNYHFDNLKIFLFILKIIVVFI